MNVYFISGLGADQRAFQRIRLPEEFNVHYLEWIPHQRGESLQTYAQRLAEGIDRTSPFVLVGLSFGGMIASSLSEKIHPSNTIIISSISNKNELPWYYRLVAKTRLQKLLPAAAFHPKNPLIYFLFGARSKSEKRILAEILSINNPHFLKWGIEAILSWNQKAKPGNLFHIHGDRDKILPVQFTKADKIISGGTHFMVWTNAGAVQLAIVEALRSD